MRYLVYSKIRENGPDCLIFSGLIDSFTEELNRFCQIILPDRFKVIELSYAYPKVTGILFYLSSIHVNQESMSKISSDRFKKELNKRNLVVDHEEGETFTLKSVVDPSRKTTIQFFSTQRRDKRKYGSHNDTTIKSIGVFSFKPLSPKTDPDFYVFSFDNRFAIIPVDTLHSRISRLNYGHLIGNKIQLVLWLMPEGHLFDATNIGVEGDWYFMGGGMACGTDMDYTSYLDNWDLLNDINFLMLEQCTQ